jgi:outer membrane receptor protein involved in Fe transport
MMKLKLHHLLISTTLAGFAMPAFAQDAPASPADQTGDPVANAKVAADKAKEKKPTNEQGDVVIVTGTRIQRPNVTSAAPITSVTAQDIKAQSPVTIEEVLNRLPQVAPDAQQNYQDSDGRQRIKLRNLGFERTLVLIDGKRLGTQNAEDAGIIPPSLVERVDVLTGGASSVYGSDAVAGVVNFILKKNFTGIQLDGNYSFYNHYNHSNIVTQTVTAGGYGFPIPHGMTTDGRREDFTLTAGTKLLGDALHVSGFVNFRKADLVPYGDRSTSACQLLQTGKDGPLSCSTSTYSLSGYIMPLSGPNAGTAYVNDPNGTRTFVPFGPGPGNAANPYDGYSYQRKFRRWNAGGFVNWDVAPNVEIYGSGIWFRDKSTNRFPRRVFAYQNFGGDPYEVNCNNPFLSASQATTLCGAAAGTSTLVPIQVRYRFADSIPYLLDTYTNSGIRGTGGVRGHIGDAWTYDVGAVYARNKQLWASASLHSFDRVNNALNVVSVNGTPTCVSADPGCVPFDAFSPGNSNQALVDYIYNVPDEHNINVGTLYDGQANVTGDLGKYGIASPWAQDGVAVAFGLEYRRDNFTSRADRSFRNDFGGSCLSGDDPAGYCTTTDLHQTANEANAEVQVPVIQHKAFADLLQANGGFRYSKYSGNPDAFTTWKAEMLYAPIRDITFRGSFNKAQRAPTVIEQFQARNRSLGVQGGSQGDFCAPIPRQIQDPNNPNQTITTTAPLAPIEVCRATGLPDNLYGSPTLLCDNNQCSVLSGGFTVDPETAYTKTYGVLLKPRFIPGLVFSVDRYKIKIKNSIGYNDYSYYQNGCLLSGGDPFFCSAIVRNPDGTLFVPRGTDANTVTTGFIRQGTTNYYYSIANGYDFQAAYGLNLRDLGLGNSGRVDFDFNGSLTTFAGGQDSPLQPKRNCAGYYGNGCGQLIPKWVHALRTTYTTANKAFSASLNWRYVGSLTSADNSGDPAIGGTPDRARTTFYRFSPKSYFDLAFLFNVGERYQLRLIANNLLDKSAPILPNSYDVSLARSNTIPQRYDSLGRNIVVGATVKF